MAECSVHRICNPTFPDSSPALALDLFSVASRCFLPVEVVNSVTFYLNMFVSNKVDFL